MRDPVLVAALTQIVAGLTPVRPPYADHAHIYRELGISSTQALQLLFEIEERCGVAIDDRRFAKAATIDALAQLVEESR